MSDSMLDGLHALRVRGNMIEARISALRPDDDADPRAFETWEQAMQFASEQFHGITQLIRTAADLELGCGPLEQHSVAVAACVECGELEALVVGPDGDTYCIEHASWSEPRAATEPALAPTLERDGYTVELDGGRERLHPSAVVALTLGAVAIVGLAVAVVLLATGVLT